MTTAALTDEMEVRPALKRACKAAGGSMAYAFKAHESQYIIDLVCEGKAPPSLRILKALGYEWSTRAGLTISISDVTTPPAKAGLLEKFEGEATKVENQYDRGIITDDERRQQEIEIWTDATNQVTRAMQDLMSSTPFNPIDMMVGSGARGNVMQVRQIAGMRGLVANPRGEIIPRPMERRTLVSR